jgi:pimeloyl-ACP methyl ester carboxylesterase
MMEWAAKPSWYRGIILRVASPFVALGAPDDPSDFVRTIEAEDAFDFHDRLGEITAPTLVVAGAEDPGYSPELFARTAHAIPNGRLVLYPGMGHPARGPRFARDLLAFLDE